MSDVIIADLLYAKPQILFLDVPFSMLNTTADNY